MSFYKKRDPIYLAYSYNDSKVVPNWLISAIKKGDYITHHKNSNESYFMVTSYNEDTGDSQLVRWEYPDYVVLNPNRTLTVYSRDVFKARFIERGY